MREIIAGIAAGAVFCSFGAIAHFAYAYQYPKQFKVPHEIRQQIVSEEDAKKLKEPPKPMDMLAAMVDKTVPLSQMTLSANGFKHLDISEGFRANPYNINNERNKKGQLEYTIGYGTKFDINNKPVTASHPAISKEYARRLVTLHIQRNIKPILDNCVKTRMGQDAYDVLLIFTFNVGVTNACKSSVVEHINRGEMIAAADALMEWTRARGTKNLLLKRRAGEKEKFMQANIKLVQKLTPR